MAETVMEPTAAPSTPSAPEQPSTVQTPPTVETNQDAQPSSNRDTGHINITTSTGTDYATRTATLFASAFSTDPVFTYLLNNLGPEKRQRARAKLFHLLCKLFAMDGLEFWEGSTSSSPSPSTAEKPPQFHASLILAPPGPKTPWSASPSTLLSLLFRSPLLPFLLVVGPQQFGIMNGEYSSLCEPVKKAYFEDAIGKGEGKEEEFFEVKMVATDEGHRGKGLCPALIRRVQERATKEGKPVWLEASNAKARRQYLKLGFKEVRDEPLVMGKGRCGEDGEKKRKGEDGATGVSVWPMVWWPEGIGRGR